MQPLISPGPEVAMFIYCCQRTIAGSEIQLAIEGAIELAETFETVSATPVSVWVSPFAGAGSAIVWSTQFESLAEMDSTSSRLCASGDYLDGLRTMSSAFTGSWLESLMDVIVGDPSLEPAAFVAATYAVVANGHRREAVEWGTRLARQARDTLDIPALFAVNVFGNSGGLAWIAPFEDASAMQSSLEKLLVDERLPSVIDQGGHLVQQDVRQLMLRRLN